LIQKNVPQRTAHEVIGRLVNLCERRNIKRLADLSDAELVDAHPQLGPQVRDLLGVQNAIKAFRSYGSTAPAEVERQLSQWIQKLNNTRRDSSIPTGQ
jgi:argininosuccinate lyase